MTRIKNKFRMTFKAAVDIPVLAASALGMALIAIGIGYLAPTGEQSKLVYDSNLWCVSNYIEQRPQVILPDGRPARDPLLVAKEKEGWRVTIDQVTADSKEEAEKIAQANGKGRFEPSDQDELRAKLQANDKDFFTSHFNTGATAAGPCLGTGSTTSQTGRWLNDAIREDCFGIAAPASSTSDLTSAVLTNGSCKTKPVAVKRIKGSTINTPSSGVAAVEQHLVTKEENFQPTSGRDRIDGHYSVTEKAIGVKYSHERGWTGAEGGGSIGGGSGSAPPAAVEPYVVNMYWADKPAEGTRMILTNPANGKSVVVAAGYETGPGNLSYAIGAQEEAMQAIGAQTGTKIEFGFAQDQSLPFGPINCSETATQSTSGTSSEGVTKQADAPVNCPDKAPSAGPSEGEDQRAQIAQQFEQQLSELAAQNSGSCEVDTAAGQAIVDEAMKYAPGADGKTKVKYVSGGRSPSSGFDCSGFVDYVLRRVKAAGTDVSVGSTILTTAYAKVGQVIDLINIANFTSTRGGAKLRNKSDMPSLSDLQPGDILFFGTSTACSNKAKCPNTIGHMGIYLGNGKFIHSTTSDKDLNKDSSSDGNNTSSPPLTAHPRGAQYADYNGVKIDDLYDSYFTPGLYIQVNRVTKQKNCGAAYNGVYGTVAGLGTTAYPGGEGASPSFGTCHGSSACNPAEDSGHGVYQNRGSGDALDISPKDGYARAAFDGTASHEDDGRNSYTVVTSSNGRVKAYYYHTFNIKNGPVKAGEVIAKVGAGKINHIHFELLVDGRSVNGDQNLRSNQSKYQASLWKNMKTVLGLP